MRISDWSSDVCSSDLRHPEGGWYVETFRDVQGETRAHSTAIYYLLEAGDSSHWHRVRDAAEVWHFYAGDPLLLRLSDGKTTEDIRLGTAFANGEQIGRASCREIVCQYV